MSGGLSVAIIAGFLVFIFSIAAADVPPLINFQGKLTDTPGFSVEDSNYQLTFSIWDSSAAGNQKWSESQTVTVKGGLFNVLLGSVTPIEDSVFNDTVRYLGIKVGDDPEMLPRTRLASLPYAHRVSTIDGANGGMILGGLNVQNDLHILGNVGIGTTSPARRLEVESGWILVTKGDAGLSLRADSSGDVFGDAAIGLACCATSWSIDATPGDLVLRTADDDIIFATQNSLSFPAQMIIKQSGNVGIGTITPDATLDVNGDIKIATATRFLSIPPQAFVAHSTENYLYAMNVGLLYGIVGQQPLEFGAPVLLPHGATINRLTAVIFDSATSKDITATLYRFGASGEVMSQLSSSGTAPTVQTLTTTSITNPIIDNETYSYCVVIAWTTPASLIAISLRKGVLIEYSIVQPLP